MQLFTEQINSVKSSTIQATAAKIDQETKFRSSILHKGYHNVTLAKSITTEVHRIKFNFQDHFLNKIFNKSLINSVAY